MKLISECDFYWINVRFKLYQLLLCFSPLISTIDNCLSRIADVVYDSLIFLFTGYHVNEMLLPRTMINEPESECMLCSLKNIN